MATRSIWACWALAATALIVLGCQRAGDLAGMEEASQAGGEKSSLEMPAAVTAAESNVPAPASGEYGGATPESIEVATEAIQPHLAIGSQGGIYVAFIQRGNISVSTSRDHGRSFSEAVVAIDVQGRARGGAHRGPRIGVDNDGTITVTAPVTFDDSEYEKRYPTADLFLVRSTDEGQTWSSPRQVNEVAKKAPEALHWTAVAPNGEVHLAWLDMRERQQPGQDIFYTTVVDGEVNANVKVASTVCECCAPGLAVDAAGNPFLAYREGGDKSSREIFAQWSPNGGRSFSEARQINQQPTREKG